MRIGEKIFTAFDIVGRTCTEVSSLVDTLPSQFAKQGMKLEFYDEGGKERDPWVHAGYIWNYKWVLNKPGKPGRQPDRYLGFQVLFYWNTDMPSPIRKEPLLHILHSNEGAWDYMEFDILEAPKKYKLLEDRLWDYREDIERATWADRQWAFVLPLTSLEDLQSISMEVVVPTVALLLKNAQPTDAFREAKNVIEFHVEDTDFK